MNNTKRVPGGICLYSSKNQQVLIIKKIDIQKVGYYCQLLVCLATECLIIGLYFSPKCPLSLKVEALQMALNECYGYQHEIVIGGDFNCEKNIDFLVEQGFFRLPLFDTTKFGSNIDQIYAKVSKKYVFGANPCYYSDHNPLFLAIKSNELSLNEEIENVIDEMDCSSNSQTYNFDSSNSNNMDWDLSDKTIQQVELSYFHENKLEKRQVYVIDRLNLNSSIGLMSFLRNFEYKILNCNGNTQVGQSCGYICASIASYVYHQQQVSSELLSQVEHQCYNPDIMVCNNILSIDDDEAQILDSTQIMRLVTCLTGDSNLQWLFTVDVNMFKSFVHSDFSGIDFPKKGNKRFGVFCVNDAVLTEEQRRNSLALNQYNGFHWYTVVVIIE